MKVAYIVSLGNGLESFIYREIEEVRRRGINPVLFSTKRPRDDVFKIPKEWLVFPVNYLLSIFYFLICFIKRPLHMLRLTRNALKYNAIVELIISCYFFHYFKKNNIQSIHCHFGDRKYFIGFYLKQHSGLPLTLTVHAHELYANPNPKMFDYSVHYADKIVSISDLNKQLLVEKHGVSEEKVEVIRLSIDLDRFSKSRDRIYLLSVARYTERKGFDDLFNAISLIDDYDLKLITIGWGDLDLTVLAKENGVQNKVIVFEKMSSEQLSFFYQKADIFCLASKTTEREGAEGIPVVLMEAMASEMEVVTTPNGSISELVDSILVEEGNPISIANGIREAILRVKKSGGTNNNRSRVVKFYSDDNVDALVKYLYD